MPNDVYVMEAVNLKCTDSGGGATPGISTHLTLSELKLPAMEENYVDHMAGGARMAIEIHTHLARLEGTFTLAGWQPEVMKLLGRSERINQVFTAYGLIRDRRVGTALQAVAVMEGRLGRVNPTAFTRGSLQHHEYSIRGIISYKLDMQQAAGGSLNEIYFWDFFTSEFRVGGDDINKELRNTLAIA